MSHELHSSLLIQSQVCSWDILPDEGLGRPQRKQSFLSRPACAMSKTRSANVIATIRYRGSSEASVAARKRIGVSCWKLMREAVIDHAGTASDSLPPINSSGTFGAQIMMLRSFIPTCGATHVKDSLVFTCLQGDRLNWFRMCAEMHNSAHPSVRREKHVPRLTSN